MTQIFVLNSTFGLMTAVAAIDSGAIAPTDGPRILLTVNAAMVPEATPSLEDIPHLAALLQRFDRVESVGALVAPVLPTQWEPGPEDLAVLERLLRRVWGIGSARVQLFLQSPQVPPSRTMAALFAGAELTVVGDGLMTYAPLRVTLPNPTLSRMIGVVYADIVPGVEPFVLAERGIARHPVPVDRLQVVVDEVAADVVDPELARLAQDPAPTVLVLGQYLASLGLVSASEEHAMQAEMVERARAWHPARIVFKPHPSAPPALSDAVVERAREHDLDVVVYQGDVPAEIVAQRLGVTAVVAGFSTALPTLRALTGTPIASVGNAELLARFDPYENSNRMPVTIVDALTRDDSPVTPLPDLVATTAYTMQPRLMRHLRPLAVRTIAAMSPAERARYIGERRLTELRLPGASDRVVTRVRFAPDAVSKIEQARLVARGARRRATRAWKELKGR